MQWDINLSFSNVASSSFHAEVLVDDTSNMFCYNININADSSSIPRFGRVLAFNGYKWSQPALSNPPFIIAKTQSPDSVLNDVAFGTSSIGIMARWNKPSIQQCKFGGDEGLPISHYVIEWDSNSDFNSPAEMVMLSSKENSFKVGGRDLITGSESNILNEEIYFLRITAFNSIGVGLVTHFIHFETGYLQICPLKDTIPSAPKTTQQGILGVLSGNSIHIK